jgi:hypothetical protein
LSGKISWSQTLQHPRITGDVQLLNAKLQNAPLDFVQASARLTFDGENGKIEFLNAATADVDVSLRGDIDLHDLAEARIDIFPSIPVFELANLPNACVNRINLQPVGITLAPIINQIELRGGLFEGGWKMTLRQAAIPAQNQAIPSESANIPLCFGERPAQQTFTFGLHPKPTPEPQRPRKKAKRR